MFLAVAMSVQTPYRCGNKAFAVDWLFRPSCWRLTALPISAYTLGKLSKHAPPLH
jgi:hypothetical protein